MMKMTTRAARPPIHETNCGYTLIETLISLFLLATAILGVATLYVLSLHSSHGAVLHDFATLQSMDIAERIRANPVAVKAGYYLNLSAQPSGEDCISTHCTPEEMAKFDLREWNRQNSLLLPSGSGDISNPAGNQYKITIDWVDGDTTSSHSLIFYPKQ